MQHVKVMLEYFHPWSNSAGFYIARERGWYRAAGLDVEFVLQDPGRGDTLEYLSRGEVELGIFPTNRLLVRRENAEPILAIAAINQRALETIQSIRSTGIRRLRDLEHKRVALNPTPRGRALVRYLVERDGGNPDAVQLIDVGARELTLDDLAAGEADATFGGYWAWEALRDTRVPDEEQITWAVDELSALRYHGYLLGGNEAFLETNRNLVSAFLDATARGYLAVTQEPEIALPVYERVAPYLPRTLWQRSLPLIATSWLYEEQWGVQREELLGNYAHWLAEVGILRQPELWRRAYTNELLPQKVTA